MLGHKVRCLFRRREIVNFARLNTEFFGPGKDQIVHRTVNMFSK